MPPLLRCWWKCYLKDNQVRTLSRSLLMADYQQAETNFMPVSAVPHSPLGEERMTGCTVGKAFFLSMVFMAVLGFILSVGMWLKKKHKGKRDPLERGCVAQGKHPNVVRSPVL